MDEPEKSSFGRALDTVTGALESLLTIPSFFDYGTLLGDTAYDDHQIESVGVGIRSALKLKRDSDQNLYLNLSAGFPLKRELNMVKHSKCRVNFSMSMQF